MTKVQSRKKVSHEQLNLTFLLANNTKDAQKAEHGQGTLRSPKESTPSSRSQTKRRNEKMHPQRMAKRR